MKRCPMYLPEVFSIGVTCQLIDLLPSSPIIIFLSSFLWQAAVGFR